MYNNKKNNFYHGIMFHHFHKNKDKSKNFQGSICSDDFYKIIKYIGRKNILNPTEFLFRLNQKKLKPSDVCLTFDDGLKSQYDVAVPILEDMQIKGLFCFQTCILNNEINILEIYRYFRVNYYDSIHLFYKSFFSHVDLDLKIFFDNNKNIIKKNIKNFSFYSLEDVQFRLIRDIGISSTKYNQIMKKMFSEKKFVPETVNNKLYININKLKKIYKLGHEIGLHSHSHPTMLENMEYEKQYLEYSKPIKIFKKILNKTDDIKFMSHPNGSYNSNTLAVLKKLGVEIGFKQHMHKEESKNMKKVNNSSLEIARQDHSIILNKINAR